MLPPSAFSNDDDEEEGEGEGEGQQHPAEDIFQSMPSFDELAELSLDNGQRRKLTEEQLLQVRQDSFFIVPSNRFPGKGKPKQTIF